ncbi:MAG: RDD family protein [Bacteroidia bacterium]
MDENLHIRTSTGVELSFELASLGDRLLAWFLDFLLMVAYVFIASMLITTFLGDGSTNAAVFATIFMLPIILYHFLSETLMNGQSIGKRARNIQVVRLDGQQATLGNYAMRSLLRLLEIVLLQGSLAMLFIVSSKYGQRLGDVAAGTTVVKVKKQNSMEESLFREVPETHQVRYPEAVQLSNDDAETLGLLLYELKKSRNELVLMRMAQDARKRLAEKLGIDSPVHDLDFLNGILDDYNYLQTRA